jgi:hypothetical protein
MILSSGTAMSAAQRKVSRRILDLFIPTNSNTDWKQR